MKIKHQITILIILIILLFLAVNFLTGCSTSKNIQQSAVFKDTTAQLIIDSLNQVHRQELLKKDKEISTLKAAGVTFKEVPCPPTVVNIDSNCNQDSFIAVINRLTMALNQQSNKVKILQDGSIEAEGQILDAYYTGRELQRQYEEKINSFDSLSKVNSSLLSRVTTLEEQKIKQTKTNVKFPWLLFVCIGAAGGIFLWEYWLKTAWNNVKIFFKSK